MRRREYMAKRDSFKQKIQSQFNAPIKGPVAPHGTINIYPGWRPLAILCLVIITALSIALALWLQPGASRSAPTGDPTAVSRPPTGTALSIDPRAQIVQLTGSWSEQGFHDAIVSRDTSIVALYLKSGMTATTLHEGASAILFGFQGVPQNGDPVALVKAFQADRFKVDDQLEDNQLMGKLTDGLFPLMFETALAPKGYTGGYQGGTFVGSLLFWIVQRALASGPTDQDIQVIKYLISQGADCKVPLSFIKFNTSTLSGTSPYIKLLPMMQSCAK